MALLVQDDGNYSPTHQDNPKLAQPLLPLYHVTLPPAGQEEKKLLKKNIFSLCLERPLSRDSQDGFRARSARLSTEPLRYVALSPCWAGIGLPGIPKLPIILCSVPIRQDFIISTDAIEVPAHPRDLPLVLWSHVDQQVMTSIILNLQIGLYFYGHLIFDLGNRAHVPQGMGQLYCLLIDLKEKIRVGAVSVA